MNAKVRAVLRSSNYSALWKIFALCGQPLDFLKRYLGRAASYPAVFDIRTPVGIIKVHVFTADDVLTVNEIFFRGDYGSGKGERIFVDFGSNIGISTLFFLSRAAQNYVYCFEPLAQNIERLKINLAPFEHRYALQEAAVAEHDGSVEFGWEPTGRYGGIGSSIGEMITVPALDSNRVLHDIIEERGQIDLLKIDIEMLEDELTRRIPDADAERIERIAVELRFPDNPLPRTHRMAYVRPITTLSREG